MIIKTEEMDPGSLYKILVGCVMPRPIAWISTIDREGRPNLAPFSFFNVASRNPPTLAISIGEPADRSKGKKDTLKNAEETGQLVVNVVTEELLDAMNVSGVEFAHGVNEFQLAGLSPIASTRVAPPRIGEAKASMECTVKNIIPIGTDHLILAEVIAIVIADEVLEQGKINPHMMKAVGRMAGPRYCTTNDMIELALPPRDAFAER